MLLYADVAQLVEQRIENPCVTGSIPVIGTIKYMMNTIVVLGPTGSGINFLKNVFLLSKKLHITIPKDIVVVDRFEFMCQYYTELQEKIKNNGNWVEHEWELRLSHYWTDALDSNDRLVKIHTEKPTAFPIHAEASVLVNDPLSIVSVSVDDTSLCERLYKLKTKSNIIVRKFTSLNNEPHESRTYYKIKFSELLTDYASIFNLTETLDLDIDIDKIRILHELWGQSNKILLESGIAED